MVNDVTKWTDGDILFAADLTVNINLPSGWSILNNLTATGAKSIPNTAGSSFQDESEIITASSEGVVCQLADTFIAGGTIYDNIDDSSIDSNLWTTATTSDGSVTEDTDAITVDSESVGSATLTSDGSGSNLNMNSGTTYVLFDETNSGGIGTQKVQITNTSTTVDIYDIPGNVSRRAYLLKVDASADTATLWHHTAANTWTALATDIDISTVTTNKYLRFEVIRTGSQVDMTIHKICSYTTDADSDLVTTTVNMTGTLSEAFNSIFHYKNGATAAVQSVSLDNGVGFTTTTNALLTTISSTGSQMQLKAVIKTNNNNTPDEIYYVVGYAQ